MRGRPVVGPVVLLALLVVACGRRTEPAVTPDPTPTAVPTPPAAPPPAQPVTDPGAAERERRALLDELGNTIHFDYDQDVIRPGDAEILDRKAAILVANPAVRLRISGHADERGSDEYNLVLGNKRALSAKRYLEARGVDGSRVEITSFGEERPRDPGSNEAAWAMNRRAEIDITSGADRLQRPR